MGERVARYAVRFEEVFMLRARALFATSVAVGILAACSGDDTVGPFATEDGGAADATADVGSSGAVDSAPPPDVAAPDTGAGGGPIACGKVLTCDSKTQDCCLDAPAVCAAKGTCTGGSLSCSDTASCASGVCCVMTVRADAGAADGGDGGGATVSATCEAACKKGELQLCATTADCKVAGDECRRGPGGLLGCRKPLVDAGADAGDAGDGGVSDASDSG
jgi:hypothetical protein